MPADDRPIPASPCPTCQRPIEAWSGDVGRVVKCRGCQTRFRIALATEVPPIPEDDNPPREAPTRRAKTHETVYDAGYGQFEKLVPPGRTVALATMHFVYFGLLSVCGVLSSVLLKVYPSVLPGPDVSPENMLYSFVLYGLTALTSPLLLIAGFKVLRRRATARSWTIAAQCWAGVLLLLNVVVILLNLPVFTGRPFETFGIMMGLIYQFIFWLGYLIPVGALLSTIRPEVNHEAD